MELAYLGLKRTIDAIHALGPEIVFIRSTPDFEFDIRDQCFDRFSLVEKSSCSMQNLVFVNRRSLEDQLIDRLVSDYPYLKVFDPFSVLCSEKTCDLVRGQNPLYRDSHHLSDYGSYLLGLSMKNLFIKNK